MNVDNAPYFLMTVGTATMVTMAIFIVLFVSLYQRNQLRQKLDTQKKDEEYQRQLLEASLQAQETERRRIAGDLHDDIGALLSATRLSLTQISRSAESGTSVQQTKDILDEAIQNVRRISKELSPATLENFGLSLALHEFTDKLMRSSGRQIIFDFEGKESRFEPKIELMLYRVVQELVNNSLKHADAEHISVKLKHQSQSLELVVEDDGIGFDLETVQGPDIGLGLKNIHSRLSVVGGRVHIQSTPRGGTRTVAVVPV
jgi:signal transduction histidine kinase